MQAVLEVWKALYLPVTTQTSANNSIFQWITAPVKTGCRIVTSPKLIAVLARLLIVFQCS